MVAAAQFCTGERASSLQALSKIRLGFWLSRPKFERVTHQSR